ncbi:hypothetical protein [Streptomyces griseorubiginosus]|uniref:hypothetical protein n=1 Tax=Streptomyces griseorubiginosus TaxID=67304 RepID=UPI0036E79C1C
MSSTSVALAIGIASALVALAGTVRPPHWAPRRWHRFYARSHGYFWLPCPLCGHDTGGHEWRDYKGLSSTVPDPEYPPGSGRGMGICQDCTRAGRGHRDPLITEREEEPNA